MLLGIGTLAQYAIAQFPGAPQSVTPPQFALPQTWIVVEQWQPTPWPYVFTGGRQPYDGRRLAPSLIAVAVNNPPFRSPEKWASNLATKTAWQPDPWPSVFMGGWAPYIGRQLPPPITNVAPGFGRGRLMKNIVVRTRYLIGPPTHQEAPLYCGRDFDPADPPESEYYGIDFVNDLTAGDSIAGGNVTLSVMSGTDPNPSAHLAGGFIVVGTAVLQRLRGMIGGNVYRLQIVITTTLGNNISLYSHVLCQVDV